MRKPDVKSAGALIDTLDCGVIIAASDGRVVEWNDWMAAASGVAKKAAIGKQLVELFPELSRRLRSAIAQSIEFGGAAVLTHALHPEVFPLRTPAGRRLIHDVSIKPIGEQPFRHCLVQVFDVTTAVEREQVLRERQDARYAAVVDNAPDAILTIDDQGIVQFANPAVLREFGYEPKELIGQPAAILFRDPTETERVWRAIAGAARGQYSIPVVGQRKNGVVTHIEVSAAAWTSRSRTFATLILRDVNERYAAEEALKRLNETLEERVAVALAQRKLLADIVEDNDAVIQVVDRDLKLLAINRAGVDEFERMFDIRPHGGVALALSMSANPDEATIVETLWRRALTGETFTVTRQVGDDARGVRHHEIRFNVIKDPQGKQLAAYQFAHDVTERVTRQVQLQHTEDALRQSQKMEAIGQLTGGIAHDFNNLLAGIIGAMEILRRRISAGRYDETQRFMDAAVASANRAAALTHRLLAFARRQPLDPRPLDPNQLVAGMEDLLRRSMGEQIVINIKPMREPWYVNTDANQLENAILNLAINARDAMPEGGAVTITTQKVELAQALPGAGGEIGAGDYVVIRVIDTGIGMPADIIAKVFDPFFTTKPLGQGTGLGLSMVYGFAQQSGGQVRIDSREGEGATISIYLPRFTGALRSDVISPETRPFAEGEGETVVLVEDDSAVRLLIGEVLRDLGYRCVEASDAFGALPLLQSNARVDLLITDVGLPRMNGRQLAEIARQHRPDLKVLFVTGYAQHATGAEQFLEPNMELVTKPFTLDALALKIRDMIAPRKVG